MSLNCSLSVKIYSSLLNFRWVSFLVGGLTASKRLKSSIYFAGFMTAEELKKLNHLYSDFNKYWMPLAWFANLASHARKEGRVKDDIALRLLMDVSVFKHVNIMHMHNKSTLICYTFFLFVRS